MSEYQIIGLLTLLIGILGALFSFQFRALQGMIIPGMPSMGPTGLIIPRQLFIELGLINGEKKYKLLIRKRSIVFGTFAISTGLALYTQILKDNAIFIGLVAFISILSALGTILDVVFGIRLNDALLDLFKKNKSINNKLVTENILSTFKQANINVKTIDDLSENIQLIAHHLPFYFGSQDEPDTEDFLLSLDEIKGNKEITYKGYMSLKTYLLRNTFAQSNKDSIKSPNRKSKSKKKNSKKKKKGIL